MEVQQCLFTLCNIHIKESTWLQITLPVLDGGMGVQSIEWLSSPAFIASAFSAARLVSDLLKPDLESYVAGAVEVWKALNGSEVLVADNVFVQRAWESAIVQKFKTDLGIGPAKCGRSSLSLGLLYI